MAVAGFFLLGVDKALLLLYEILLHDSDLLLVFYITLVQLLLQLKYLFFTV